MGLSLFKSALNSLDKAQRIRFNRTLLALVTYFLAYLLVLIYRQSGVFILDIDKTLMLIGLNILFNLFFLFMIVKGINLRFKDPSLTIPQIVTALIFVSIVIYFSSSHRGSLIVMFVFALTFGFFRLNRKEFVYLSAFTIVLYFITISMMSIRHPEYFALKYDSLRGAVLLVTLAWFTILGSHMYELRMRLNNTLKELRELNTKLSEYATTDELTGLYNRREILRKLREECIRATRYESPVSIAMVDLDHFKAINDTFGHEAGDLVLKRVSYLLKSTLRDTDSIGRFGGEEFLILLPNTPLDGALVWGERARGIVEAESHLGENNTRVTCSFGVAQLKEGEEVESLLRRADQALYGAKRMGRNRVVASNDKGSH